MKWNEVTRYSRWGAIILFLIIVPVLSFYIGRQYEKVGVTLIPSLGETSRNDNTQNTNIITTSSVKEYKGQHISFKYPSDYFQSKSFGSDYTTLTLNKENVNFMISNVPTGFENAWTSYAPTEVINRNGKDYTLNYFQSDNNYRILGISKNSNFYMIAILPSKEAAENPEIQQTFKNILYSIQEF